MDPKPSEKDSDSDTSTETDISHPILKNAARCASCGTVAESKKRLQLTECACGSIWVDGGKCELRYGFDKPENFIPMFEVEGKPDINKEIEKVIKESKDN